jgi:hypothetical protein
MVLFQSLWAYKPFGCQVHPVGMDRDDFVSGHGDFKSAQRFADATECVFFFCILLIHK